MSNFNYNAAAELYPSKSFYKSRQVRYQRFASAAEALRYAIEEMPAELLRGSLLEVDEQRFEGSDIRDLYYAEDYPLARAQG
ncbi:MAG: hypothetical protein K0R85_2404 [Devosia sp.]|nr:hypothetical protein [Devosia sp.]